MASKTETVKRTIKALERKLTNEDKPTFDCLKGYISSRTLAVIKKEGFTHLTEIQAKSIPQVLKGKDVLGLAKTGSGKTLAFLLPAIERLLRKKFDPNMGTGVIVISPTRELATQTFNVLEKLLKHHCLTCALVMGGNLMKKENEILAFGANIVVATPGRLLEQLTKNESFNRQNLVCLIIDEADKMMDDGFEKEMNKIMEELPEERQTLLFSATTNKRTQTLIKQSLKEDFLTIGLETPHNTATVEGLTQYYILVPDEKRFDVLYTFLKDNHKAKKKTMVFFSSINQVIFFNKLFGILEPQVLAIHGDQDQTIRSETFMKFVNQDSGILLCTNVASRGLDIPNVDTIIQYDPPQNPNQYIHRVGRTIRKEGAKGEALLFLRPNEESFVYFLVQAKIPIKCFELIFDKFKSHQQRLNGAVSRLKPLATKAYSSYLKAYGSHSRKETFDLELLDLTKVAQSFGLKTAPSIDLKACDFNYKRKAEIIKEKLEMERMKKRRT